MSPAIIKRASIVFAASYFIWGVTFFQAISLQFSRTLSPNASGGLILTPIYLTALVVGLSIGVALATLRAKEKIFLRTSLTVGILLDLFSLVIVSKLADSWVWLMVHITLLVVALLASGGIPKLTFAIGIVVFAFPWFVVPICSQTSACGTLEATLITQGYRGFNIIIYDNQYYAIPQGAGAFNITAINTGVIRPYFVALSPDQVKQMIDASVSRFPSPPTLEVQGYKGYNVILYNNTYYGILQSEGAFDIVKIESGQYSSYFVGNSVLQVEQMIDAKFSR
jgi:hypothetical protein